MQEKIINIYRILIAFSIITIIGTLAFVLRYLSFKLLTEFNRKLLIPFMCKMVLFCIGIRFKNTLKIEETDKPLFYTFNHNSYLDGLIIMSLGLKNTRVLLSEIMLLYIPITLTALSIGVLYIPTKNNSERRLNFFYSLEKRIKKEKINFTGSSEGVHDKYNEISEFNRGVYHTAMNCKMDVVALFIFTPKESNPGSNFLPFKKGEISIELLGIIPTTNWILENLDNEIESIRNKYVNRFNELHSK